MVKVWVGLLSGGVLVLMGVASYLDLRKREVGNWVWLVFLAFALPKFALHLVSGRWLPPLFVLAVYSALALVSFYVGGVGGADAKALICLSLAFPNLVYLSFSVALGSLVGVVAGLAWRSQRRTLPYIFFLTVGLLAVAAVFPVLAFQV